MQCASSIMSLLFEQRDLTAVTVSGCSSTPTSRRPRLLLCLVLLAIVSALYDCMRHHMLLLHFCHSLADCLNYSDTNLAVFVDN